jgi:protein gp37
MGELTGIEWADHTFPQWFGCERVSPACDFCYAEDWTVRRFHKAGWGNSPRVRSAKSTLEKPRAWDRKAAKDGVRRRVFCSQLSDIFDNRAPEAWRRDLWALIAQCRQLDWMILTKRPQNIRKMLPERWPWPHVWLGVTGENQQEWDRRVTLLREISAVGRFVSVEPMLEPIEVDLAGIGWIICGGETDPMKRGRARSMDPGWARRLRDDCAAAGVAFFMKQMADEEPIPDDLLVREFPRARAAPAAA